MTTKLSRWKSVWRTPISVVALSLAACSHESGATSQTWSDCKLEEAVWSVGGDEDGLLFNGIVDIEWLTDTTVAIAERTSIRVVATTGDDPLVATLGREGDGPGDFRAIRTITASEDGRTIWAYDSPLRRISRLGVSDPTTEVVHFAGDEGLSYPSVAHLLADGRAIVDGETPNTRFNVSPDGTTQGRYALALYDQGLQFIEVISEAVPQSAQFRPPQSMTGGRMVVVPLVFGSQTYTATNSDILVVANSDSAAYRKYSLDDLGSEAVRWEVQAGPVSDAERERRIDILLRLGGTEGRDEVRDLMRQAPRGQNAPRIGGIMALATGEVLVADYKYLLELPTEWRVFRNDVHVGNVTTPARFRIHSVRGSMVVGVQRDDFDVEHVETYLMSCTWR